MIRKFLNYSAFYNYVLFFKVTSPYYSFILRIFFGILWKVTGKKTTKLDLTEALEMNDTIYSHLTLNRKTKITPFRSITLHSKNQSLRSLWT